MIFLTYKDNTITRKRVNVDAYGNAIPNTASLKGKHSSIASSIVGQCEIITRSSKKKSTKMADRFLVRLPQRLFPWQSESHSPAVINEEGVKQEISPRQEQETIIALPDVVELSLQKLNTEFQRREQQFESRFQALQAQQEQKTKKKSRLLIPMLLAGALAGGYVLYVLTSMQNAMTVMSKSIPAMNQHMSNMAADTRQMSGNMQVMNQSIHALNGNVHHMNRQMGTVSKAMKPMGMFSKFMPF